MESSNLGTILTRPVEGVPSVLPSPDSSEELDLAVLKSFEITPAIAQLIDRTYVNTHSEISGAQLWGEHIQAMDQVMTKQQPALVNFLIDQMRDYPPNVRDRTISACETTYFLLLLRKAYDDGRVTTTSSAKDIIREVSATSLPQVSEVTTTLIHDAFIAPPNPDPTHNWEATTQAIEDDMAEYTPVLLDHITAVTPGLSANDQRKVIQPVMSMIFALGSDAITSQIADEHIDTMAKLEMGVTTIAGLGDLATTEFGIQTNAELNPIYNFIFDHLPTQEAEVAFAITRIGLVLLALAAYKFSRHYVATHNSTVEAFADFQAGKNNQPLDRLAKAGPNIAMTIGNLTMLGIVLWNLFTITH